MASGERSQGYNTPGRRGDIATWLGIFTAFGLVFLAIFTGTGIAVFANLPSIMIVMGGTFGILLASYSFRAIGNAIKHMGHAFVRTHASYPFVCNRLLRLAQAARSQGVLVLQSYEQEFRGNSMMHMGMVMLTDGMPIAEIEAIMQRESVAMQAQRQQVISLLKRAAEIAPAMGLIGTLIGLVQMLGNLDDPDNIGPAMAVALLTTFYGAVLANLFFNPMANKLERIHQDESTINQLYVIAIGSIARQENPRRLEILMNTVLPPNERVRFFE